MFHNRAIPYRDRDFFYSKQCSCINRKNKYNKIKITLFLKFEQNQNRKEKIFDFHIFDFIFGFLILKYEKNIRPFGTDLNFL
jgi:hypothetical protein